MAVRDIVEIDEEKCDGCGLCVIACAEGALEIRDGKAKVIRDIYCDGLGACIGECPQDALTIIEKEAKPFDEEAMEEHLRKIRGEQVQEPRVVAGASCPGAKLVDFQHPTPAPVTEELATPASALCNWPIQIHLLPVNAPFFRGADLLIAADCVPFAMAGFHQRLLPGKVLAVGCPKLDNAAAYIDKFSQIFAENDIESVTVGYMEVPCCAGLVHVVQKALEASGKAIPVNRVKVSVQGQVVEGEVQEDSRAEATT